MILLQKVQQAVDIVVGLGGFCAMLLLGPLWLVAGWLVWGIWPVEKVTCVGRDRRRNRQRFGKGDNRRKILMPSQSLSTWRFCGPEGAREAWSKPGLWLAFSNLPLCINLMRREISLFGPQLLDLETFLYLKSLLPQEAAAPRVKPGLMGLSQLDDDHEAVLGRYRRKLALDRQYQVRRSIFLDGKVLIFSLLEILSGAKA